MRNRNRREGRREEQTICRVAAVNIKLHLVNIKVPPRKEETSVIVGLMMWRGVVRHEGEE